MKKNKTRFEISVLSAGAVVYSFLYALGSQIDQWGEIRLGFGGTVLRLACAFPIAFALLLILFRSVFPNLTFKADAAEGKEVFGAYKIRGGVLRLWLLLLCAYIPMFLIVFPGSFTYDSMTQIAQIASGQYDAFHPLLHTLLIRACLSFYDVLQSMEKCGAVYSVLQMMMVSWIFAHVCGVISRIVSRKAGICAAAFFALYPSHFAFASNCTKDVLFSACIALFVAFCMEEIAGGKLTIGQHAARLALGTLACLLRNNMIYAMIVWVMILLLTGRRLRRIALCGALSIILSFGVNAALMNMLHADNGNVREMLSIPMQQLARARVYAPDTFTQQEKAMLDEYILDQSYNCYNPTISDAVKNALDEDKFLEDPMRAVGLWWSIGKKNPKIYLDAFLNQTHASLYPYAKYMHDFAYIDIGSGAALTAPFGLPAINPPARFEKARTWLHENLFKNGADACPVLRWIFNTGLVFWLLLAHVIYEIYHGYWARVLMFFLPVLLWGTYLLGPIMYGRYLYPFICMLPLFVLRRKTNPNT